MKNSKIFKAKVTLILTLLGVNIVFAQQIITNKTDLVEENLKGSIKSIITQTYNAKSIDSQPTNNNLKIEIREVFNNCGNLEIKIRKYPIINEQFKEYYKYENNCNTISQILKYRNDNELYETSIYDYTISNIIKLTTIHNIMLSTNPKDSIDIIKYHFDRNNKLLHVNFAGSDGSVITDKETDIKYKYSIINNNLDIIEYYISGSKSKHDYDLNGNLVKITSKDRNGVLEMSETYNYENNKLLSQLTVNDALTKITTYNKFRDPITVKVMNTIDSKTLELKEYSYTYDSNNNWIKRIVKVNDKVEIEVRKITY